MSLYSHLHPPAAPAQTDGYCGAHGARMPHYSADGVPCTADSPDAQRAYRASVPAWVARNINTAAPRVASKELSR